LTRFRCAVASLDRDERVVGTASTVRAFLLVEFPGGWGRDALTDSRLPHDVRTHLGREARSTGTKILLIRRHGRWPTSGLRVFAAYADPLRPWMESTVVDGSRDLLALSLDPLARGESLGLTPHDEPVFLTCAHGRHDTCCAERGRPVAAALAHSHPELSWEVSHIGGDRFAANVLILPDGLYYGRVTPGSATALVENHLSGHLNLDLLRGRSGYPFAVQAAEWFLRDSTGLTGTRALRLVSSQSLGDRWTADFRDDIGRDWRVRLSVGRQPEELLTCAAGRRNAAPAYELIDITPLGQQYD